MTLQLLFRMPAMADLGRREATILSSLRHWATARQSGRCAIVAAATRLGSKRAAVHLHLLLEEIGSAWPEPFAVSPPCCPRLSHDEALLAGMVAAAAQADRPAFDRLLCDLLPDDARERLFLSARVLCGLLR